MVDFIKLKSDFMPKKAEKSSESSYKNNYEDESIFDDDTKNNDSSLNQLSVEDSESIDNQAINDYYKYLIEIIEKAQSENNGYISDADLNSEEWQAYEDLSADFDTDTLKHARAQAHIRFKSEHANNKNTFCENEDTENEEKVLA